MDAEQRRLLNKLTERMIEDEKVLSSVHYKGIKKSVVDKYSEKAHFVYELLQNADDARAKSARFVLLPDRLIFAHDGTKLFNVTDIDTEKDDSENHRLGHVNSITSIGLSTKEEDQATIGKFGMGFKAVFQYTTTPHIYSPGFYFKIEKMVIPYELTEDHPDRKENETLFDLEFNNEKNPAPQAYKKIFEKLHALSFPTLFLRYLQEVTIIIDGETLVYKKAVKEMHRFMAPEDEKFSVTVARRVDYLEQSIGEEKNTGMWLFSRRVLTDTGRHMIYVGYGINNEGHLCKISKPVFCFFPTTVDSHLNFIIHAPFLLTDSREGIIAGEKHNEEMIECLADLATDALELLRDIG